jgi:hypothetical protein
MTDTPNAPATPAKRTLAEIIIAALSVDGGAAVPICYVHENLLNIQRVKAGTKLTLGIPDGLCTPDDALWFTSGPERAGRRTPKYVGLVVFVPMAIHEQSSHKTDATVE